MQDLQLLVLATKQNIMMMNFKKYPFPWKVSLILEVVSIWWGSCLKVMKFDPEISPHSFFLYKAKNDEQLKFLKNL